MPREDTLDGSRRNWRHEDRHGERFVTQWGDFDLYITGNDRETVCCLIAQLGHAPDESLLLEVSISRLSTTSDWIYLDHLAAKFRGVYDQSSRRRYAKAAVKHLNSVWKKGARPQDGIGDALERIKCLEQ